MILRMTALTVLILGMIGIMDLALIPWEDKPEAKTKKALAELQEFVGLWNLEGTQMDGARTDAWKEKVSCDWKFKGSDSWLVVEFGDRRGKHFTSGTLKYVVAKNKYVLALTATDQTEQVFVGDVARGTLRLQRKDPESGDVYRLTMNTLDEGARLELKYERQEGGKGLFASVFAMSGNKDDESMAGRTRQPE